MHSRTTVAVTATITTTTLFLLLKLLIGPLRIQQLLDVLWWWLRGDFDADDRR